MISYPNRLFYLIKPFIPRTLQIALRRRRAFIKLALNKNIWPIDERADKKPDGWAGWPDQKQFALVLMHDVDTEAGHNKCRQLMKLDEEMGFRSVFNFVPERYQVSHELRHDLVKSGFEIGVHGLKHDGKLFLSRKRFNKHAVRINQYLKEWKSVGFVSPSMHRNLDWMHELNIEYDASTFDTDPFEPQSDGMTTIFPFIVPGNNGHRGYIELPYTLPQDFTLFVMMKEKSIDIWKKKLDWIAEKGGMALLITHPDYMNGNNGQGTIEEYPMEFYKEFLDYIRNKYANQYWNPLPMEMTQFWRENIVGEKWRVQLEDNVNLRSNLKSNNLPNEKFINEYKSKVKRHTKNRKIWIDLDNSPHVPFFIPIMEELEKNGHSIVLTARDCFQVCGLADYYELNYRRIGKHYGANKLLKVIGTVWRSLQLAPIILKEKPDLSLSHGSRSLILLSSLLGIPTILLFDYEYTKSLPFIKPALGIAPEVINNPDIAKHFKGGLRGYSGLKEDVYAWSFRPDSSVLQKLYLNEQDIIATIRPPATEAHYHNPESEKLFFAVVEFLGGDTNVKMVILPRNEKTQRELVFKTWPKWCEEGKIIVPDQVLNGLDLIWHSDLVVSGGGTMNRESAALGVPVYSIFRGKIGAVDRYLAEKGRLTLIETVEDVKSKIRIVKRTREKGSTLNDKVALKQIVSAIEGWIG